MYSGPHVYMAGVALPRREGESRTHDLRFMKPLRTATPLPREKALTSRLIICYY